jgi:hypothetical protein
VSGRLHKAEDWHEIRDRLVHDYSSHIELRAGLRAYVGLDHDTRKIIENMDVMVENISKLEIDARKGKVRKHHEAVAEFNDHLEMMEQFFLINKLTNG